MRRWVAVLFLVACGSPGQAGEARVLVSGEASARARDEVDVVSGASAKDEGPPVLAHGKIDGAALRERNRARLAADASPVVALVGDDAATLGERLCEAVVPRRPAATPVLVKPNIGGFDYLKDPAASGGDDGVRGRITNPEFVRGVIRCLKARGHQAITLADGWGGPHTLWQKLVQVSGYARVAAEEKVPLVCLCDDGVFDVQGARPGEPLAVTGMEKTATPMLMLPRILAEHLGGGLFIEVPKIKAHRFSVVSLGIKNLQGVVMSSAAAPAHKQKWRMHGEIDAYVKGKSEGSEDRGAYVKALERFAARMIDVLEIAAPDAVLLEGTPAMQGDGFKLLVPLDGMIGIGGTNAIRVDQVGARYLGAWDNELLAAGLGGYRTSPLIVAAGKRFGVDFAATQVTGDAAEATDTPRAFVYKAIAPVEIGPGMVSSRKKPLASRPEARAVARGDEPIAVDGDLGDAPWQRAKAVRFASDWQGRARAIATSVRFVWGPEALYVGFELEGAGLFSDTARPIERERERLYEEDCVEIFLGLNAATPERYFEIELGPFGHWFDLAIDRGAKKREDVAWSSGLTVKTTRDAAGRRAVIEASLAAPEIIAALASGARLPLGLYRVEGKGERAYLAWSPTMTAKPSFHVPERFGVLALE
jgi:uncharacterized protein (DUF362 family)